MFLPTLPTLVSSLLLSRRGRAMIGRHMGKIALAGIAWQLWKHRRGAAEDAPAVKAAPPQRRRSRGRAR
ncbi:cysteine protease [Brevundimonas naejangsanensis]|uniref:cysteine protease n=1 Tax=Brevundimonas naejangsanensis TaxID=588932 RepID=UPI003CFBEE14